MRKLLTSILALLMLGCLDYTALTKIKADGSGTARIEIKEPRKQNLELKFVGEFDAEKYPEGWETTEKGVDTLDTYILHYLEGKFSKLEAIPNFISEKAEPEITVSKINGISRFHLKRNIEPLNAEERRMAKTLFTILPVKKDLSKHYFTEILIIEGEIIEHNATIKGVIH